MCGKAYLSYPALYTHIKTKHDLQNSSTGKGRGRPKKDNGTIVNINILIFRLTLLNYFITPIILTILNIQIKQAKQKT
jgi:hypothetical protein